MANGKALAPYREVQMLICKKSHVAAKTRESFNEHITRKKRDV